MDVAKIIDIYNKTAEHYAKDRAGKEPKKELDKFKKLIPPIGKILDVGCAAGRDSRILKDSGLDVIGIDLSDELLKIARGQNPDIKFINADMRELPFDDESFDGVWSSAVLHHLEKQEIATAIEEYKRVLKLDGILMVKTKRGKGVLKIEEEMIMNEEREFTLLEEKELDQLLTVRGFEKIELYANKSMTRDLWWLAAFYRKI